VDNAVRLRIWLGRVKFTLAAAVVLFAALVPLNLTPQIIPGPDLLFALVLTVVLRRPEFAPFWLIAAFMFLADILEMRPPGLWAAIVLVASEVARAQEYRFRDLSFLMEWALVAVVMFMANLANQMLLTLTLAARPDFGAVMLHYLVTLLAYPLVAFICYFLLRIRKVTPDDAIRFGHRL